MSSIFLLQIIVVAILIMWVSQFLIYRTEEWWKARKIEKKAKKFLEQLRQNLHDEFETEIKASYREGYEKGYSDKEKDMPNETKLQHS